MTLGVLGGGQLGRMLALAGLPLDLRFRFLDPAEDPPAAAAGKHVRGEFDDHTALAEFARGLDLVTYEFENVPAASVAALEARGLTVKPAAAALAAGQDRLAEKRLFERLDIPTAPFRAADTEAELRRAVEELGPPVVAKTRRLGYDGKGQTVVRSVDESGEAWSALGGVPLLAERFVGFTRELSIIAVRRAAGEVAFYPLVENEHRAGILRTSVAPAPAVSSELRATAEMYAARVLRELAYEGALAIELFQAGEALLANELAPRVHNSGHWTIEGAETSQFENHLRAILDLPLGATEARGHAGMANLIGGVPDPTSLLRIRDAHVHLYGKSPRAGRKLGHVTVVAPGASERDERLRRVLDLADAHWLGPG